MTKIMKSAERRAPANKDTTEPTIATQTGIHPNPTKVLSKTKMAAVSKVATRASIVDRPAPVNATAVAVDMETVAAPAMPKITKQEQVLTMLSQNGGATVDEIMKATGWQQHSVRGFFAGTVRKKLGFELTSEKEEGCERCYAIKVAA